MKRIKWKNMALLIILIICSYVILHDMYMLTIYTSITGKLTSWTLVGFTTFVISIITSGYIVEYFNK